MYLEDEIFTVVFFLTRIDLGGTENTKDRHIKRCGNRHQTYKNCKTKKVKGKLWLSSLQEAT